MKIIKYSGAIYYKLTVIKKSEPGWLWGVWNWVEYDYEKINTSLLEDKTLKNTKFVISPWYLEPKTRKAQHRITFTYSQITPSYEKPLFIMQRDEGKTVEKIYGYWLFKDNIYKVRYIDNYENEYIMLSILEYVDKENRKRKKLNRKYRAKPLQGKKTKEEYINDNGYIYILSNPSMPGLLKIGFTNRPVDERVEELNAATGVPTEFTIEAYFQSEDARNHEARIHNALYKNRIESKEFFSIELDNVLAVVEAVLGSPPCYLNEK